MFGWLFKRKTVEDAPLCYPIWSGYWSLDAEEKRAYRVRTAKKRQAEREREHALDCPSARREATRKAAETAVREARKAENDAYKKSWWQRQQAPRDVYDEHTRKLGVNHNERRD